MPLRFSGEAYHKLHVGDTGSGKTTGMRQGHAECRTCSIWANYNNVHNVSGSKVNTDGLETVDDLRFRILSRLDEFNDFTDVRFNVGKSSDWPAEDIVRACYLAGRDIFDSTDIPTQLCIDEIHNFWDKDIDLDPAFGKHLYKEGRGEGIFLAGTTQDPADMPNVALKQVYLWFWYGPPAGVHNSFLSHSKWSWMPTDNFPKSDHSYIAFDKKGVIHAPSNKQTPLWHTKKEYAGRF